VPLRKRKFKRCCADKANKEESTDGASSPAGRFRYEAGSYRGPGVGYMPSILCFERSGLDTWREHFCLVNPEGMVDDPEAASAIADKHLETAFAVAGEDFAMSLKGAGYAGVSDFNMAVDDRS
jgi:hypothetical protein